MEKGHAALSMAKYYFIAIEIIYKLKSPGVQVLVFYFAVHYGSCMPSLP